MWMLWPGARDAWELIITGPKPALSAGFVSLGYWTTVKSSCYMPRLPCIRIGLSTHRFQPIMVSHHYSLLTLKNYTGMKLLTLWAAVVSSAIELSTATRLCSSTNETHPRMPSTVQHATVISAATRLYSITYETRPRMLRPSTVRVVIDRSAAKRLLTSTCRTRPSTLHPSSVRLAIDPSAAMRLWSSTCGTLASISGIWKPL